ncbi:xanthine dehydrogenase family protein molybdopterin-binding subunit [Vibrio sp. SCSIO 43137]|uniref:xanthine dehydrogenase family protein molybdopterin-binding subunit n=1 Tax=Vibrio sp. SCSIO 43137 TaxID=3021011 RepID=UPI002307CC95|nr:xanthine dehydrogenase family protein molybdopterin-binding subunit [Vibrio sp. SCSIO 43137]WCE31692.1 xanthine dehydrogenase family protein molybdopterin-binding subunit [Vibrio sp. SCSIO 43137]
MDTVNPRFKWDEATGKAKFIADRSYQGLLEGIFYRSTSPRGQILSASLPELPEGYYIFGADDVPGRNVLPIVEEDWPVFADKEVYFIGQIIYLLVGPDKQVLHELAKQIEITYQEIDPVLTVEQSRQLLGGSIRGDDNLLDHNIIRKGDIDKGFEKAVTIIEDTCTTSYQEHNYLETQGMVVYPQDGKIVAEGSMQCPFYVHHGMNVALGHEDVRAVQSTTGGGFGGKEEYPEILAAPMAVAVEKLQQPVRVIFDRVEDIAVTSKRHPAEFKYRTGVDADGNIVAMDVSIELNGGAFLSLSGIVLQRMLTTCTNVYDIPNVRASANAWATNTPPNGAFRGFGSPQNCFAIETHMTHIAKQLGEDPVSFKRRHLLNDDSTTMTGAPIFGTLVLDSMLDRILELSEYSQKTDINFYQKQVHKLESGDYGDKRRGIGLSLFQHGCGFAGDLEDTLVKAKVKLVKDEQDEVYILASNTDIGQGISLTFRKIVAKELGLNLSQVHYVIPDTDVVPDSGPTVASRSIMIVGFILENAARKLRERWCDGVADTIEEAYKKPDYHKWDQEKFTGNAYQATSYGINVVEVDVDMVTCETTIIGAWAVYDIGRAIDPDVFKGQIDGGFVQALGYGSCEKLELNEKGEFSQKTMADYVIPTSLDVPVIVSELIDNPYKYGPQGAKGGGELTHNGAAAAFACAVEDAIGQPVSSLPVSPESIFETLYCSGEQL